MLIRTFHGGLAGAGLLLSLLSLLTGQDALVPSAHAQPDAAGEVEVSRRIIVIADPFDRQSDNARLRAALYETARERGYEPLIGVDVEGPARRLALVEAGEISADPAALASLRSELQIGLLVRVSREGDPTTSPARARIAILSDAGTDTRSVEAPEPGLRHAVATAFGEMLPAKSAPPPPEPEPEEPGPSPVIGQIGPPPETNGGGELDAARIRELWQERGGARFSYGVMLLGSALHARSVPFQGVGPTGEPASGEAEKWGVGGGVGVRMGLLYMPLPDPNVSAGKVFPAFRLGARLDTPFFWARNPAGFRRGSTRTRYDDQALWAPYLSPQVGLHLGFGSYHTQSTWRGVVLGVSYSPALQYMMDLYETSGDFDFNPVGLELTLDITNLSIKEQQSDAETQIQLSLLFLAPVAQDRPGLITAGIGAVWY